MKGGTVEGLVPLVHGGGCVSFACSAERMDDITLNETRDCRDWRNTDPCCEGGSILDIHKAGIAMPWNC
jgi:hypothetical protein